MQRVSKRRDISDVDFVKVPVNFHRLPERSEGESGIYRRVQVTERMGQDTFRLQS